MEFSEVIALAKAGFSAEQIEKIAEAVTKTEPAPTQTKLEEKPAEPAKKEAPPEPAKNYDAIIDRLDKLTTAIHANAIINSKQPDKETPDDILASIINPKKGEK